jgi:protein-S-isoprenylcysteine O-methyltransferase Ste14
LLLATPAALGSYWAYIIFLPTPLFIVPRLLNEEKVLLRDLPGYEGYCKKMKYHLIPYIW